MSFYVNDRVNLAAGQIVESSILAERAM